MLVINSHIKQNTADSKNVNEQIKRETNETLNTT